MLKLKLQYFGHLLQTADSLEMSLMLGKIEDRKRRGCQKVRWLDGITEAMGMNLGKFWEMVRDREVWCCKRVRHNFVTKTNNNLLYSQGLNFRDILIMSHFPCLPIALKPTLGIWTIFPFDCN